MSTIAAAAIEEAAPDQSPETIQDNYHKMSRAELLSKLISQELDLMTSEEVSPQAAKDRIDQLCVQINQARTKFNKLLTRNMPPSSSSTSSTCIAAGNGDPELERDLQLLNKEVRILKSMFPFCLFKKPNTTDPHINWRDRSTPHFISAAPDKLMRNLMNTEYFNRTPTPQELKESLEGTNYYYMRWILACFLVVPQNAIVKKSLLVRWAEVHAAGDRGTQLIHDIIAKGLIHPVYKDTLTVGGYWMHSFVRSMLSNHNWLPDKVYVTDNSSEDIFYDDPTPFLAKRKLDILHLGNWQRSSLRHIEVEDPNSFFKDMAKLSDLGYVSLRGVSLVTEMPKFITKLRLLKTLDLKSCHNLEGLPSSIGNLASSLTHLDMSECYFLEDMPMALSELHSLWVLKGFVVREDIKENSCTLHDLLFLQSLRKLNVYTHVRSFPNREEQQTLKLFRSLRSLTISWGGCSLPRKQTADSRSTATTYAIERQRYLKSLLMGSDMLDKLDLQCVPETVTHDWLNPANFRNLKKLYIRGGRFCNLGQEEASRRQEFSDLRLDNSLPELHLAGEEDMEYCHWNVEILRLKHLENLEMEYRVLQCLFPKLICLENVKCPNLKNFPCNEGAWKDNTKPPPTTYI